MAASNVMRKRLLKLNDYLIFLQEDEEKLAEKSKKAADAYYAALEDMVRHQFFTRIEV